MRDRKSPEGRLGVGLNYERRKSWQFCPMLTWNAKYHILPNVKCTMTISVVHAIASGWNNSKSFSKHPWRWQSDLIVFFFNLWPRNIWLYNLRIKSGFYFFFNFGIRHNASGTFKSSWPSYARHPDDRGQKTEEWCRYSSSHLRAAWVVANQCQLSLQAVCPAVRVSPELL